MCGRFCVDEAMGREIRKIVKEIDSRVDLSRTDEIFPSQMSTVITGEMQHMSARLMQWGFPPYNGKRLLINARAETVTGKKAFRDSVYQRRCLIPARQYFEWDSSKVKVTISRSSSPVLYMAGFYQRYSDGERFVIITTRANDSVRSIHDRMPLILEEAELEKWLYENAVLERLLSKEPPELVHFQEYEQQRLPFCF